MILESTPMAEPELRQLHGTAEHMKARGVMLHANVEAGQVELTGELDETATRCLSMFYDWLVIWWRVSPTSITACDTCGEPKLYAAKESGPKKCTVGQMDRNARHKWGCQGSYRVVDLPWDARRPRRRREKIKEATT